MIPPTPTSWSHSAATDLMLQTLHAHMRSGKPIYGMHRGTVGFLMNEFCVLDLHARLAAARDTENHPLLMRATDVHGKVHLHHAINEVVAVSPNPSGGPLAHPDRRARTHAGTGRRRPHGGDPHRIDRLQSFGAGSDPADQRGAAGVDADLGVPARRWRGALLPNTAFVVIEVLEGEKRPVAAVADHDEARNVRRVEVISDKTISMRMLFDPGHSLEEQILSEQFGY